MLKGNWWGVNNPIADDMSCFPNTKHMFLSKKLQDVIWINSYWKDFNLDNNTYYLSTLEKMAKERVNKNNELSR